MNSEAPKTNPKKIKIIDSFWVFCVATAVLGPFALPLLWRNPRYKVRTKVIGSAVIIALTLFLLWISKVMLGEMSDMVNELNQFQ